MDFLDLQTLDIKQTVGKWGILEIILSRIWLFKNAKGLVFQFVMGIILNP